MELDYYFSLVSPWAYLGHARFMALAARHGAKVNFIPINLGEVFPHSGGAPFAKRHPARLAYRMIELQRWREKLGLKFALELKGWPFDPTWADQTVLAFLKQGENPADYILDVFSAVFEQEKDLGKEAEIAAVLQKRGVDADKILTLAKSPEICAAYRNNSENALEAGVFGSPSYLREKEIFWGQDRLDFLEEAIVSNRAPFGARISC